MTVCVIDDDPLTKQQTSDLLESAGYKVRPFDRPDTFLKYARDCHPVAAIVDLGGSHAEGLKIRARLREVSPITSVIISLKIHQGVRSMLRGNELVKMIKQICSPKLRRDFPESQVLKPQWRSRVASNVY